MDREEILQALSARIIRYATSRLWTASDNPKADAEDLAQEVLIVLMQKYDYVEDPKELFAIGIQTLDFKIRNASRKKWRRKEDQQEPIDEELYRHHGLSPESLALSHEKRRQFQVAVRSMDEKCQQLLRLHHLEGVKFKDIADSLGEPESTVNGRWRRCRKALADKLHRLWGQEGES